LELDEIAGWHLEQAVSYRAELGQADDSDLGRRAAEHLYAAGVRAYRRSDLGAARSLLGRAHALAPAGGLLRAQAAAELAAMLASSSGLVSDELLDDAASRPETALSSSLSRLAAELIREPGGALRRLDEQLPPLLEHLSRAADVRGIARCHLLMCERHWISAQARPAGESARLAAGFALQIDDHGLWTEAILRYTMTLLYGDTTAAELRDELEAIERQQPGALILAAIEGSRAELDLWEGDLDSARRRAQSAWQSFGNLGMGELQFAALQVASTIEQEAGNTSAALEMTEQCDAQVSDQPSFRSTTQATISRLQAKLGHLPEARQALERAEALSAPDDLPNFVMTHAVRARIAVDEGDGAAAERWARSAVDIAFRTDFYRSRTEALLDLADVLDTLGRPAEAAEQVRRARAIYERKEHRPGMSLADARLAELATRREDGGGG
jgi:tetratricopeptide (TPR) repeat protein